MTTKNTTNDSLGNGTACGQSEAPCSANNYPSYQFYCCLEFFTETVGDWDTCPRCGLRPKEWVFDNGRSTGCGCGKNYYDHFSVYAESIMSVHARLVGKEMNKYDPDGLRKNWNHWCRTGEILFEHAGNRSDGRW